MKKTGTLATYPPRKACLKEMLLTILPQLDQLFIYCNQYTPQEILALSQWLQQNKGDCLVAIIDPDRAEGNIMDMGKIWCLQFCVDYVFLLDDDLRYPSDYTDKHIQAIELHGGISTVHGRIIRHHPVQNYFRDTVSSHYKQMITDYNQVNIAGTGTVAFNYDYIEGYDISILKRYIGQADIYFAREMKRLDNKIYCLPRPENWLINTEQFPEDSIYQRTVKDDHLIVEKINETEWPWLG